jgi:hypothetical protein
MCLCSSLIFSLGGPASNPARDTSDPLMAYIMCQEFITDGLKAPTTAEFPNYSDIQVIKLGEGTYKEAYRVRGYVDAQNSFGAMIRTSYLCDISYEGQHNWHLIDLEFDE